MSDCFSPSKVLDLRAHIRMERMIGYEDFIADADTEWDVQGDVIINLWDMEALIKNMRNCRKTGEWLYDEWLWLIRHYQDYITANGPEPGTTLDDIIIDPFEPHADLGYVYDKLLPTQLGAQVMLIFKTICDAVEIMEPEDTVVPVAFEAIEADIENIKLGKSISPWQWSDELREKFLLPLLDADGDDVPDRHAHIVRGIIDADFARGDTMAMRIRAYCQYGGNKLYECDWTACRDTLLKLVENESVDGSDRCMYANTLGYIYYYDRCNNGEPEYDKACKYFSMGMHGLIYESAYKLADMYLWGKGVAKNEHAAFQLISWVYDHTYERFLLGEDTKFADAALRMGNAFRYGKGVSQSWFNALHYYTIADFAIRRRVNGEKQFGDSKVFGAIQKALAETRAYTQFRELNTMIRNYP